MKSRWTPAPVLIALLTQLSHHGVNSAGQLQIRLVSFTNPDSLLADGERCCQSPNSVDGGTCTRPCRTFFRVCAAADGSGVPLQSPVRLSRISRLRSRRGRRSPSALSQQFTDTDVPSGLPSIGEKDDLLPAEHRAAEEPSGGTSIQVIHHLISTAEEEEPTVAVPPPPTGRSTADTEDTEPQVLPLEESVAPLDTRNSATSDSSADADSSNDDATVNTSPLEGSALVGRAPSQQHPVDNQDVGLVFVEDNDYIHLYFQPKRPRTRRRANNGSAGDPPPRKGPPTGGGRQRRSVRTVLLKGDISSNLEHTTGLDDLPLSSDVPGEKSDDAGEGSGSDKLQKDQVEEEGEERGSSAGVEGTPSRRLLIARQEAATPKTTDQCPLGVLFTAVVTNSSLEEIGRISFPFDTPWPGKLNLLIEAWHDVTGDWDPLSADLSRLGPQGPSARLIGRAVLRRPLTADSWSDDVIRAGRSRLEVRTRVVCGQSSDGPHCATACDLAAGGRGHWQCLEDGSVTCRPGWKGTGCDQPVCRAGCSAQTGYCRVPGECLCKIGYHGELCSKCVPLPGCRHGFCKRSFECRCREGWTGLFCNKPICAKGCDRIRGYCTQPNECRCRPGWRGSRCDLCQRLPGCRHGSCEEPLQCRCRPGWTGFLCERAICREGCSKRHGYCEQPDVCRCELGWRGALCDACLPYPGCLHGNCTAPWECNCHPGWTGFLCDKPAEPCTHQSDLCKNGGICEMVLEEGSPVARCRCAAGYGGATCKEPGALQLPSGAVSRSITGSDADGDGSSRWPWGRPKVPLGLSTGRPGPVPLPWRRRRSPGS